VNHSAVQVASNLYVGNSGGNCALSLTNGGTESAGARTYIGITGSSTNNSALVSGAGSALTSSGELHVGESGAANSFTISNGGAVHGGSFAIIGFLVSSVSNAAVVTGPGSVLTCGADLHGAGGGGGGGGGGGRCGGAIALRAISFTNLQWARQCPAALSARLALQFQPVTTRCWLTGAGSSLACGNDLHVGQAVRATRLPSPMEGQVQQYYRRLGVASPQHNTVLVTGRARSSAL